MDASKSYITFYNISPEEAEDFEFDHLPSGTSDLVQSLVPNQGNWGDVTWIELDEYEYDLRQNRIQITLETKWEPPIEWLRVASQASHSLENKLATMTTIQKDETCVTGVAVMGGDVLQNKLIFEMESEEVGKYYDDDEYPDLDLDDLDDLIWNSINKFVSVCERYYLEEGGTKNDNSEEW